MAKKKKSRRRGVAAPVELNGMRATRLREIQNDIVSNLGGQILSIHGVASRHGVSVNYLRSLFTAAGTTFSKFVMEQRLGAARAMLRDRRFTDRSIAVIAFSVGFGDLPSFNRRFRKRFGIKPADLRQDG